MNKNDQHTVYNCIRSRATTMLAAIQDKDKARAMHDYYIDLAERYLEWATTK